MKTKIAFVIGGVVIYSLALGQPPQPAQPAQPGQQAQPGQPTSSDAQAAYQDMQKTFGFVPGFFKAFPENGISGAWDEMKSLQMNPKTALPPRTKELIGLAVAATIPCRYCAYFHTKAAKANGANDNQAKEALAISALEVHWAAIMSGLQVDPNQFRQEITKMFQHVKQHPPQAPTAPITDANSAMADMQRVYGMVPSFMRQLPPEAVPGAWKEMRAFLLDPNTALDAKTKSLVGLAVAAQVPCMHCVTFETEGARNSGASDAEMHEAIVIAAITRHWSTVLNGSLIDEAAFRRDVDRMMKNVEKMNKTAQQP